MNIDDVIKEMASGRQGHFAAALAEAWYVADIANRWKIEINWAVLIHKVSEILKHEAIFSVPK